MIVIAATSELDDIVTASGAEDLACSTIVQKHPDGPLGFQLLGAEPALRTVIGEGVLVELANLPRWEIVDPVRVDGRTIHQQFRRVVTCTCPCAPLLASLAESDRLRLAAKKNELKLRYGRPTEELPWDRFQSWIVGDRLDAATVTWASTECARLIVWRYSEYGLHGRILCLARRQEGVLDALVSALASHGVAAELVATSSDLPSW